MVYVGFALVCVGCIGMFAFALREFRLKKHLEKTTKYLVVGGLFSLIVDGIALLNENNKNLILVSNIVFILCIVIAYSSKNTNSSLEQPTNSNVTSFDPAHRSSKRQKSHKKRQ